MSRIDDLLGQLSPAGVEFRFLGDIARLVRGNGMPKTQLLEEGVGAIHYGQIYTRYGAWTESTISFVASETAAKLTKADPGDLIITNTSENIEDIGKAVAWLGREPIVTGGHATVIKHAMEPKFLSYWFQTEDFAKQKRALATGTKVVDVSAKKLESVRLPVPPLEVQREIVRVLDQFTQLEAELEAELEARRAQYEYYSRQLVLEMNANMVPIGELGDWRTGGTPTKSRPEFWANGTTPWLASMDVTGEIGEDIRGRVTDRALVETSIKVFPVPSVVVVMRSNILRRHLPVGLVTVPTTINQDVRALIPNEHVNPAYVYQALRAFREEIRSRCVRLDGSMAAVESRAFLEYKIPLPSLARQREVAKSLAYFNALSNDLSVGLPAELAARRKQYEYYRDKLLTFKEAAS